MISANAEDAINVSIADSGNAEESFPWGGVDVDGEELGMGFRPRGLWVFGEGERRFLFGGEFTCREAVEPHEPIGLIEAMLADQGRGLEREASIGSGVWAEAGVVDATKFVLAIEVGGRGEDFAVRCGQWRR